jgi:hypothetical protein
MASKECEPSAAHSSWVELGSSAIHWWRRRRRRRRSAALVRALIVEARVTWQARKVMSMLHNLFHRYVYVYV